MPKKTPSKNPVTRDKDYQNLLAELKSIIAKSEYQAYKAVDNIKVQTYWQLGERIVREELKHQNRADYGKYLIDNLAVDLGIGRQKLYRIVKFYRLYEIVSAVPIQLSWGHFIELIGLDDSEERLFYQHKAIINSWGVRELRRQTQRRLYQNTSKNEIEETLKFGVAS
jgi:hypothetical protein